MRTPAWEKAFRDVRRLGLGKRLCDAYQDCDGFDNYNTPSLRWSVTGSPVIGTAYRRFAPPSGLPGQGIYLPAGSPTKLTRGMASNASTVIAKIAYYPLAFPGGSSAATLILGFGTAYVTALTFNSAGGLELFTAWNSPYVTSRYTSGPGIISPNTWYGIEIEMLISSTVGTLSVWVNGTQVINATALNTDSNGTGYVNSVQIGDGGVGAYFDDYRLWDSTGAFQNAPAGIDTQLVTKLPSGAGGSTNWTPNGAAANWQCVDDNPPDGDTTYVSNSATGASSWETYAMPSAGFTAAPLMVVARSCVRKDDSATRTMTVGVWRGIGGQTGYQQGGPAYTLTSSYAFTDACIVADPNAGLAWTAATADAALHFKWEIT